MTYGGSTSCNVLVRAQPAEAARVKVQYILVRVASC